MTNLLPPGITGNSDVILNAVTRLLDSDGNPPHFPAHEPAIKLNHAAIVHVTGLIEPWKVDQLIQRGYILVEEIMSEKEQEKLFDEIEIEDDGD